MSRRLDLRVGTRNVTRWAPAVVALALVAGCDGGPRPEPRCVWTVGR